MQEKFRKFEVILGSLNLDQLVTSLQLHFDGRLFVYFISKKQPTVGTR